jgi:tyrosyl-tRNA synthetase
MLERQDFQNRYSSGQPISLHEFIYPLMQGYDSLMIKADVEIGGTDQKFNVLRGRELQKHEDQDAQIGLFMPILLGTCGKEKMSKSLGNYIGLNESAQSMYHKVYKIPDALIANWFELLTDIPMQEIDALAAAIEAGSKNPNEAKSELALNIVSQYHGEAAAQQAKIAESKIHSGGAIPEDAPEFSIAEEELPLLTLLQKVGAFSSNGEAKRMIQNGGVKFNQEKVADFKAMVQIVPQSVVQVGKRKFYKINY